MFWAQNIFFWVGSIDRNFSSLNTIKKKTKNDVSYETIADTRERDIIERTQISLTSLTN